MNSAVSRDGCDKSLCPGLDWRCAVGQAAVEAVQAEGNPLHLKASPGSSLTKGRL